MALADSITKQLLNSTLVASAKERDRKVAKTEHRRSETPQAPEEPAPMDVDLGAELSAEELAMMRAMGIPTVRWEHRDNEFYASRCQRIAMLHVVVLELAMNLGWVRFSSRRALTRHKVSRSMMMVPISAPSRRSRPARLAST